MNPDPEKWGETEPETMTEPQEEFIGEKSRPSVDISELRCPRCGKPQPEWEGEGVSRGKKRFCSEACAAAG